MATMQSQRQVSVAQILGREWQLGSTGDNVRISIFDIDDNNLDVDAAAMTSETGGLFSYGWTPAEQHTYRVDYSNITLDTHEYEIIKIVSEVSVGN